MQDTLPRSRHHPPQLLVAAGAAFVIFQAWAYVRWALSDIPLKRASVPIPEEIAKAVEGAELFLCAGAIVWLIALCIITLRNQRMTLPLLLTLGWSSAYWQESLVNTRIHAFSYNAHFLNRGDWIPYLPLVGSDRPLLNQPLLMEAPVFFWMIPAVCLCACGLMRLLSRWITSPALRIPLASSSVMAFETGFEFSGIRQQLLAWNHVPQSLSLRPAAPNQWPLPELLLGLVWSLPAVAWFYRDRAPLRWLDLTRAPAGMAVTTMRVLALSALINVGFLAYNVIFMLMEFNARADLPPWLAG